MICRKCGTPNPDDSKFCNKCGAALRPATSLICPSCGTSNPNDLLYCDNCGTRLQKPDVPGEATSGEEPEEAPPTPFTLPSRPPGKTANLNISDGIPDWLKTGDKPATSDKKGMQRHRPGDDLPTWLLDEGMEPDLFGDSRTTDELFASAEQAAPEEEGPVEQELPEWLRGLAPEGTGPLPLSSSRSSAGEDQEALDAWLADFEDTAMTAGTPQWIDDNSEENLSDSEAGGDVDEAGAADLPGDSEEDAVASWLADLVGAESGASEQGEPAGEPEPPAAESTPADWLAGLEIESETDGGSEEATEPAPAAGSTAGGEVDHFRDEGIPGWLSEEHVPEPVAPEPPPESGQILPDWLADLDESPPDEPGEVEPSSIEGEEIPDWLAELEGSEQPAPGKPAPESESTSAIPDWLGDLEQEPEYGEPAFEAPQRETEIPGWLSGLEDLPASVEGENQPDEREIESESLPLEPAHEETPGWLRDLEALPADLEEDTQPDEFVFESGFRQLESAEEETPDWLRDLEALPGDAEEDSQPDQFDFESLAAGPDELQDAGIPDWLNELPSPELEQVVPGEELPDWLQEEEPLALPGEDQTGAGTPPVEPESAEPIAAEHEDDWLPAGEEAPDWLLAIEPEEQPQPEPDAEEEVPDWLTELDAAIGELEAASSESGVDWLEELETTGPAAHAGTGEPPSDTIESTPSQEDISEPEEPELLPAWLAPTELSVRADHLDFEPEEAAEPGEVAGTEPAVEPIDDETESVPDWLQELEDIGEEPALPAAESEVPEWLREGLVLGSTEDTAPLQPAEEPIEPLAEANLTEPVAGEAEEDIFGDLLGDLDEDQIVPADELPDWLDDVVAPEPGAHEPLPEEMDTVPEVLASHDLPGWLEDSLPDDEIAEPTPAEELPEWLTPPTSPAEREPLAGIELGPSGEWNDVLGQLTSAGEISEELSAAEIPEWLQALKPGEHERERAAARAAAAPPSEGPLAGLPGVLGVEPVIARPRSAEFATRHEASHEQQQQAALLQQLVRSEPHAEERVVAPPRAASSPWLRLILTLLLLAAVLAGLFLPDLLPASPAPVYPVAPVTETLSGAAGQPVLVIFDYTPAVSGVLDQQASTLLDALAAQDSPVIYGSQSAAGVGLGTIAVKQVATLNAESLGYIPAETLGLRRLAACLVAADPAAAACSGYPPALAQAAAIVLITGERDSLVNWIEQVETTVDIPVVAGVTRALVPVAAPYLETGQVDAMLAGEPGAIAFDDTGSPPAQTAQTLATWLVVALLLVGNLIFLLTGRQAHR